MILARQQIAYEGRLYAAGQTIPIRDRERIREMLACGSIVDTEKTVRKEGNLERMKKAELQELARTMGLTDEGTAKELAERIREAGSENV